MSKCCSFWGLCSQTPYRGFALDFTWILSVSVRRPIPLTPSKNFSNPAPIIEIGVFHGLTAPKLYVPHQNWCTNDTYLGCQLGLKMTPIIQKCATGAVTWPQAPLEITHSWLFCQFWGPENPCTKIWKIFNSVLYACAHQFTIFVEKIIEIGAG